MLRPTNRLTDTKIKAGIRRAPEIGKLMLNDGNGLYLQIHNRVPSWLHRYQINGRARAMGLGRYSEVSLVQARELAEDNRRLKRRGVDPLIQRQTKGQAELVAAAKQVPSFETCAKEYITRQLPKWRNPKSEAQWTQSLRDYVYPTLGALPVDVIDRGLVIKALDTVWTTHPVTGERIRARIQKILDYAATMDYRSGNNPALWTGKLEHVLTAPGELHTRRNFAALPYTEIATFMVKLRACASRGDGELWEHGELGAQALELLILSNSRTNEVLGGRKEEVNLTNRTWTRPASRMKSYKKPHTVPLSKSAVAILERMMAAHPESPFLFPGETPDRPLAPATLRRLMARLGYADFDVQGFRACFRTWVQDCTNLDRIAAEIALAHKVGNVVEETYARGEMFAKRRVLADAWDAYCNGETGEVVIFPAVSSAAC
jgi:integrase